MDNTTLQHVSFLTQDKLELPALFYEPQKATKKVALFLHGNGSASVFYKPKKMKTFAQTLAHEGWAFFAFNNRGAHYIKKFRYQDEQWFLGTALEKIADCALDLDAAIAFLSSQGYNEFVLIGESSGANKICVYNHLRPHNPCRGYALIGGGDDTGLWYQNLGQDTYQELVKTAQEKIAQGQGQELLTTTISHGIMTYQALWDTLNPDGLYNCFPFLEASGQVKLSKQPLFHLFSQIQKPSLVTYGELDAFCVVPPDEVLKILKQHAHPKSNFTWHVEPGADHSFSEHEEAEARLVAKWLHTL